MALFLGLLVATAYGSADFLGGFSVQTSPAGATVLVSQTIGLVAAVAYSVAIGADAVHANDVLLGALAGFTTVGGLVCLYRGLALGRASVVAPVSAVGAAVLQVSWGLTQGEDPGMVPLIGVVLAIVAIGVVAATAGDSKSNLTSRLGELGLGSGAALLLGSSLILFSETSTGSGLWPIVVARIAPLPVVAIVLVALRQPLRVRRHDLRFVGGAGALDATANALLILALREGLVSLVAPVAALYPVATVVLARIIQREHLSRARVGGLAVALAGLVLIALR